MQINTLYQLYAACQSTPRLIDAAEAMVTIPDLLNYWLTGISTFRVHQRDNDTACRREDSFVVGGIDRRTWLAAAVVPAAGRAGNGIG